MTNNLSVMYGSLDTLSPCCAFTLASPIPTFLAPSLKFSLPRSVRPSVRPIFSCRHLPAFCLFFAFSFSFFRSGYGRKKKEKKNEILKDLRERERAGLHLCQQNMFIKTAQKRFGVGRTCQMRSCLDDNKMEKEERRRENCD